MKSEQQIIETDDDTIVVISKTTYTKDEFKQMVFPLTAITTLPPCDTDILGIGVEAEK